MDLTSPDFDEGQEIPKRHTCDGDNAPPELRWSGVPSDVVELALTCEDPDAPSGVFVHWVAWAIPPSAGRLTGGAGGVQGRNGFGKEGYGGPCPPPGHGPHRYQFTLYGLREAVTLEPGADINNLRRAMEDVVVATATLMGTYER
jgi:Raf kinase inhibitor-like YbhB/YbcL family protein